MKNGRVAWEWVNFFGWNESKSVQKKSLLEMFEITNRWILNGIFHEFSMNAMRVYTCVCLCIHTMWFGDFHDWRLGHSCRLILIHLNNLISPPTEYCLSMNAQLQRYWRAKFRTFQIDGGPYVPNQYTDIHSRTYISHIQYTCIFV